MEDKQVELVAEAFRKVLSEGAPAGESERIILIKRIPIICNDIIEIKTNIKWNTWITTGMACGVGTMLIMLVVALLTKIV